MQVVTGSFKEVPTQKGHQLRVKIQCMNDMNF